jgi:glycosyltransferase involved in cell wall biosynthesis
LEPGFFLCVSRLLPYKNVDAVVAGFGEMSGLRLVVVGSGPLRRALAAALPRNVFLVDRVDDARLRWLYRSCQAVVAASYEDFGLTPLEAAAFGKPSAVLRWGGFLDTVVEGETGTFFSHPAPGLIKDAVLRLGRAPWDPRILQDHASRFSPGHFLARVQSIVNEEERLAVHSA